MPKEYSRTRRVAELIRRELAELINSRLNDPRMRLVTVTAVDVSRDLRSAKVLVTQLASGDAGPRPLLAALNQAAGYLRRELGKTLQMKNLPALRFEYDHSVERGVELSNLIDRVNARDSNG